MVYERREKIETIINPHTFENDGGKSLSQMQVNTQQSDLPTMFGKGPDKTVPKAYSNMTKKFDNNNLKLGLREP